VHTQDIDGNAQASERSAEKQNIMRDKKMGIQKVTFNLITLLISSAVLVVALWAQQAFVFSAGAHGRYYVTVVLWISGAITAITMVRWLRFRFHRPKVSTDMVKDASDRQRQHYRIQFDGPPRPLFVQKNDAHHAAAAFTCPVHDVSETGISLDCKGVYTLGQPVQGEIIFTSGRTAPVNGVVIREETGRTCLRLHCTIDPPVLMAEQRERITLKKGNRPRPGVSKSVLDTTAGSLPSHAPKGICRLKRP
jgi:hypothetical protein